MLAEKIKDRIRLLEIVDSFGETGASFERIGKEWWRSTKGGNLDLRTFHRYRRDIEEIFGVKIECRRAGSSSTYYISNKGDAASTGDRLRLTCINAFLMGNMLTDDRFPKDRVFISASYNNEYARVVARAISLNRVIFVKHKHLYQKYAAVKDENMLCPVEIRPEILEFEFIPYALSYNSCWYMFGKRPGEDELLVYSLQNSAEIRMLDETAEPPEDFRLGEITSDFRKHFPVSDDLTDRDDRLQYLLAGNQSMYRIF